LLAGGVPTGIGTAPFPNNGGHYTSAATPCSRY